MTEIEFLKRFGNNLKKVMEDSWMTQNELSEETGISESTIGRYIRGDCMASIKNVINIMVALDCEFEDLIDFYGHID